MRRIAPAVIATLLAAGCVSISGQPAQPTATAAAATAAADPFTPRPYVTLRHPEWSRNAVIYQINTRQFTPEGTFRAAQGQLPRLKALGVDILWLMPIHPIGAVNRKGTLGSPYSVKDYRAVNPEFGTEADLRAFIDAAHAQGMKVIIDWVANHSAWDNSLRAAHPEWYARDWKGANLPTPWWDWSDIIDFDYRHAGLRRYMTEAMEFWVRDVGVDGFRADVAGYVPLDFWETARARLDAIKPVFMLGEFDQRDIHARAFDASYAWKWNNAMHDIAMGKGDARALFGFYSEHESAFPREAMRMVYTENHDQNAWEGTQFERFGKLLDNAIILSFLGEGIPLIHNGQEAGNDRRLKFFEKDPIVWKPHRNADLFRRLITFRDAHPALWNAPWGSTMVPVVNTDPGAVFSFVRGEGAGRVMVLLNMTATPRTVGFTYGPVAGDWRDWDGGDVSVGQGSQVTIPAHGARVFSAR